VDYSTLIAAKTTPGSIRSWVRYNELFDVEQILVDAQGYIYQRMRIREMRMVALAQTITIASESVALPSNFLDPIKFQIRYPRTILHLRPEAALFGEYRDYDSDGELLEDYPANYCIMNDSDEVARAYLDVKTVEELRYDLLYFGSPALLAATSNETNVLTNRYPHILRQACIGFAGLSMKDYEEGGSALKMADGMIDNAKEMDDLSRRTQEA
jgi:hypothetical protein